MDVKKVKRTMKVGPKKDKTLYGLQWVNYGNVSSEALLQEVRNILKEKYTKKTM